MWIVAKIVVVLIVFVVVPIVSVVVRVVFVEEVEWVPIFEVDCFVVVARNDFEEAIDLVVGRGDYCYYC